MKAPQGGRAQLHARAMSLARAGQLAAAHPLVEDLCRSDPADAQAWYLLGALDEQLGRTQAAMSHYSRAVEIKPRFADARNSLGALLEARGRFVEAAAHYAAAVAQDPAHVPALYNCGSIAARHNRWAEAAGWFERVLRANPAVPEAGFGLASALKKLGRPDEADRALRQALTHRPDYPDALNLRGNLLQDRGQFTEATRCYSQALAANPRFAEAWCNAGTAQLLCGQVEAARASYLKAVEASPQWTGAHSNYLLSLNYLDMAADTVFNAHREWGNRHGHEDETVVHLNPPDPGRRLRVGYVSPDFRDHSVAFFIAAVLQTHHRENFDVVCFSNVAHPDRATEVLKSLAGEWHEITHLSDRAAADLVRWREIDILVDLAGHTAGNRLGLFACRPAPVQATYLGYPNTTGLTHMHYRITDAVADPAGATDSWHTERLVRLPGGFLCYTPPLSAPAPGRLPMQANGYVTFGCFNNCAKFSPPALAAWSEILRRVPDARLVLKGSAFCDAGVRERFLKDFAARGIAAERLSLLPRSPSLTEHLDHYNTLDIALDTWPYNGTTTTCEALWMGVPVVTRHGERHAARVGLSILTTAGITELAAHDDAGYIARAVTLAGDPVRLAEWRGALRDRMANSRLCDRHGFVNGLEAAYRQMWRQWCGNPALTPLPALQING